MPRLSSRQYVTGWKAVALLPIAVPVILILRLFGIGQYAERSAEEVARFIRDFVEDTGDEWDWDDFICVSIKNPSLDAIRQEASMVNLPVSEQGLEELKKLIRKAEALQGAP